MRRVGIAVVMAVAVVLVACGGNASMTAPKTTTSNPTNGARSETLVSSSGQALGSFTFDITQNNTALMGSNMNFTGSVSLAQCFGTGTTMVGQVSPGMVNGGAMSMAISFTPSGSMGTNTLVMQGTMAAGMVSGSGTFTLTGQTAGCSNQTGTFTIISMM